MSRPRLGKKIIMTRIDLESCKESTLVYEVIIEVVGEVFIMQRSMDSVNDKQRFISYKKPSN
jgi:hypothetical protein